jgi:hypothetical protein
LPSASCPFRFFTEFSALIAARVVAGMARAVNLRSNASLRAAFSVQKGWLKYRLFFAHIACFLCSFTD